MYRHDIFYKKTGKDIIAYIPGLGKLYRLDNEDEGNLPQYVLSEEKELFHRGPGKRKTKRVLVLTEDCNLCCSYCYEGGKKRSVKMDIDFVRSIIIDLFNEAIRYGSGKVSFSLFGGEPTLCWRELTEAVNLSEELSERYGIECIRSIVTNGFMDIEKAEYLINNFDNIYISFDGPEDIFTGQRAVSEHGKEIYKQVFETAKYIYKNFKKLQFKVTVTSKSIDRLDEIMSFFNLEFPFAPQLYQPCMVDENSELYISFEEFLKKFFIYYDKNVLYKFTYNSVFKKVPSDKFCNLSVRRVVYPGGTVLSCHRCNICDSNDIVQKNFTLGEYENGNLKLDMNKINDIGRIDVNAVEGCSECFARYHCSGGCPAVKLHEGRSVKERAGYCRTMQWYTVLYFCKELNIKLPQDIKNGGDLHMIRLLNGIQFKIEELEQKAVKKIDFIEVMKNGM